MPRNLVLNFKTENIFEYHKSLNEIYTIVEKCVFCSSYDNISVIYFERQKANLPNLIFHICDDCKDENNWNVFYSQKYIHFNIKD